MTSIIHHGPPGSFKSFAIVQRVVIPALLSGRVVVTNIRGLDDIDLICESMGIEIPDTAELINVEHTKLGFEHMARFFSWAPIGALIVMDECQQVYPSRLKNLVSFDTSPEDQLKLVETDLVDNPTLEEPRPDNVEVAFEKHRHMGWDIYMSTPHISKVNKEVRLVCQFAKRHRDLSGVLPWWKHNWREYVHDPENSGKSKSHEVETPQVYKADTRVFGCYRSTGIGTPKKSNEKISIFSDIRVRVFLCIIVCSVSAFFYLLSKTVENYSNTFQISDEQNTEAYSDDFDNDPAFNDDQASNKSNVSLAANVSNVSDNLSDPIAKQYSYDLVGKSKVYYVGTFKHHHFNVVSDEGVISLTSEDFESVGYSIERLSSCIYKLTNGRHVDIATCSPISNDRNTKGVEDTSSLLSLN